MDQIDLLIVQSIIDVLSNQADICTWICYVFCFYWFETFAIISENKDVLVGAVDIAYHAAGASGVGKHYAAIDTAGERAEADRGYMRG